MQTNKLAEHEKQINKLLSILLPAIFFFLVFSANLMTKISLIKNAVI